jgi:hypothetical protein
MVVAHDTSQVAWTVAGVLAVAVVGASLIGLKRYPELLLRVATFTALALAIFAGVTWFYTKSGVGKDPRRVGSSRLGPCCRVASLHPAPEGQPATRLALLATVNATLTDHWLGSLRAVGAETAIGRRIASGRGETAPFVTPLDAFPGRQADPVELLRPRRIGGTVSREAQEREDEESTQHSGHSLSLLSVGALLEHGPEAPGLIYSSASRPEMGARFPLPCWRGYLCTRRQGARRFAGPVHVLCPSS